MDANTTLDEIWEALSKCISNIMHSHTKLSPTELLLSILDKHKIRYFVAPDKSEFNFRLKRDGATTLVSIVCFEDGSIDEIITEGLDSEEADYPNWNMLEAMIARNDRM
jgi:hypothetical protein